MLKALLCSRCLLHWLLEGLSIWLPILLSMSMFTIAGFNKLPEKFNQGIGYFTIYFHLVQKRISGVGLKCIRCRNIMAFSNVILEIFIILCSFSIQFTRNNLLSPEDIKRTIFFHQFITQCSPHFFQLNILSWISRTVMQHVLQPCVHKDWLTRVWNTCFDRRKTRVAIK